MFRYGIGVEVDAQRSVDHLVEAADDGESNAQIMLGHAWAGTFQTFFGFNF